METDLRAREYTKADWPMVELWWSAHTSERAIVPEMLPPVGVVVERDTEPVAALWCHLSAGVGIAFLENPVTRPGLTLAEASRAMKYALGTIEAICETHDYGLMIVNTLPQIARWLERKCGFIRAGERVQLLKPL